MKRLLSTLSLGLKLLRVYTLIDFIRDHWDDLL